MAWLPYASRDAALRDSIDKLHLIEARGGSSEDFYNEKEFGMLSDDQLRDELNSSLVDRPRLEEGNAFEVRSLRFLRNSAEQADDRRWAEIVHDSIILELWLQYVAETGDTYYPPMSEDLYQSYQLQQEDPHG